MSADSFTRIVASREQAHEAVRFRRLFRYEADTGELRWRVTPGGGVKAGDSAGCNNGRYIIVGVDRRLRMAHIIVWTMCTGQLPSGDIDHRNGIGTDNRLENLRDVSHAVNNQNERRARSQNRCGFLGVAAHRNGRFRSTINVGGKQTHLGYFATAESAYAAYVVAKRQLHEGCML